MNGTQQVNQKGRYIQMGDSVTLRRLPYPYKAMLAVCSDLDETPDRHVYWEMMRFLNTTEMTAMGPGVGLEVGNSIYFDMPLGQFSYWNTDDAGREMIRALIRSGHIDCLHSYGDLATTRADAERALDELARHDCRLKVWVDHAVAPTNFGRDIMHGWGDVPGHPAYHADLTLSHGVRFVWRGRVTSVIGQDVPTRLTSPWTARHPVASTVSVAKETSKHVLALQGNAKYAMHGDNRVLRRVPLRDGAAVDEFIRANPHWGGVSSGETAAGIGQVLTDRMLGRLIRGGGVCILYTHLGKMRERHVAADEGATDGFRRLADAYTAGDILVATTSRVLEYIAARDRVEWSVVLNGPHLNIDIHTGRDDAVSSPLHHDCLGGMTFYAPENVHCHMTVDGVPRGPLCVNPPDHAGRASVSVPWLRQTLPACEMAMRAV